MCSLSHDTFSGGEESANDLKTQGRATIVGQRTGGGANPGHRHRVQDHFAVFVPDGRSIDPINHGNWETSGVAPDRIVPSTVDSKAVALKMAKERLALQ
jgi:C-terminal processing protease CtpA/Prc